MLDILPLIINYVNDGKTYKSILYSSKLFYDIMLNHYPTKRYTVYNQLWSLINLYPDKNWNWCGISCNSNTTINIIKKNFDKPWDWCYMSTNPNIPLSFVKENPDKPWDWYGVSRNPN